MSEVSKVPNTVLLIKDQRACQRCRRCETLYCKMKRLCMSEVSKVVFVAFTQHYVQSTTHVGGVEGKSTQRACRRCRRCETLYCKTKRLCMSEVSKWCLWLLHNTAYRVLVRGVEGCTLYTVASSPCQEGRLFQPSVLGV